MTTVSSRRPITRGGLTINTAVYGGQDAVTAAWPWMASLQFYNSWMADYEHVCGAALIHPEYLLTAAHCVDERSVGA